MAKFKERKVKVEGLYNQNKVAQIYKSLTFASPNCGTMFWKTSINACRFVSTCSRNLCTGASYVQGQSPEPRVREYFYFIDHQGQLFLDDTKVKNFITCFKDKKFLSFFFKRLKLNNMERYAADFPYLSPCGAERNFIRCDDRPIVFTKILPPEDHLDTSEDAPSDRLICNFADSFTVKFEPEKVCMLPKSGRIYHPAPKKTGGIGLIKSSVAIEISPFLEFGEAGEYAPPTHFNWNRRRWALTNEILHTLRDSEKTEAIGS